MTMARDLNVDRLAPMVENATRLTTWYAQGHTDGFGDRLLMFDNTTAPSWEILRFTQALARDPKFEAVLRQRMERLSSFHHPAFPHVRSIRELGHDQGLAVVSTYVSGVRLADLLKKPRSAEFAVRLIRQLMPALNALHEHGPGIAHGALTLDRVVLTADGRLMLREHMLASAIACLQRSSEGLWNEFGILTPPSPASSPPINEEADVYQLAVVALSLIAGRRMTPDDYPEALRELLGTIVRFEVLRRWLERALRLTDQPFASAREAHQSLDELQREPCHDEDGFETTLRLALPTASGQDDRSLSAVESADPPPATGVVTMAAARRPVARTLRWVALAAGVLAAGEAVFIGQLFLVDSRTRQAAMPVSPPQPDDVSTNASPLPATLEPEAPSIEVLPAIAAVNAALDVPDVRVPPAGDTLPPSAAPRNGGFRISAAVELHVLDGERVLGSSRDGPIIVRAGRHQLEFVNSVIGYRVRREVDITPGQIASLSIAIPNGTLNVNATPWAAVWIDGTPFGETPLGNLSIAPGDHEILFRHPQLGERRARIVVRSGVLGRVAVNMQE